MHEGSGKETLKSSKKLQENFGDTESYAGVPAVIIKSMD